MDPDGTDLVVAPTADYTVRSLLQTTFILPEVQWYRNSEGMAGDGTLLTEGPRLQLSSSEGGTHSLSIANLHQNDSGLYIARISSLRSDTNTCPQTEASCDEVAIPLLTHHAITRPVTYQLTVTGTAIIIAILIIQHTTCGVTSKETLYMSL